MWKISALALLTATVMAGSTPASAQYYGNGYGNYYQNQREQALKERGAQQELGSYGYGGGCDFSILQRSDGSNPSYPAGWVHDPVTQAWLAPNSAQAELACVHQAQVNAAQGAQGAYNAPRYRGRR